MIRPRKDSINYKVEEMDISRARTYIYTWREREIVKHYPTCTTETKDIADPVREGGFDNLVLGLAEYAEEDAERAFNTYKSSAYISSLTTMKQ